MYFSIHHDLNFAFDYESVDFFREFIAFTQVFL